MNYRNTFVPPKTEDKELARIIRMLDEQFKKISKAIESKQDEEVTPPPPAPEP